MVLSAQSVGQRRTLCIQKYAQWENKKKYIESNNIYIYIYTKVIFIFIYIHFINLFFMFVLLYIYILSIYFYVCTFVFMSLWHHNLINLKSKVFIPNRFLWTFLYLKIKIRLPFSPIQIQEKDVFFDFFTWKFLHLF